MSVFSRLPHLPIHSTNHTIDKFSRLFSSKSFGQFDCLVNRNFGRHLFIISKNKFPQPYTQNIPVNNGYLGKRPFWSCFCNQLIESIMLFENPMDQLPRKFF